MVEVASEHGYGGATVSRVVTRAGVSRAAFYGNFADREDCFRAAYRQRAQSLAARLGEVAAAAPRERPAAVLDALLVALADDRPTAHFLLVDALGAPASVRREHEDLLACVERRVAGFLDAQPAHGAIQIPAAALVAGVGDVLAREALADCVAGVESVRSALTRWLDAYRLPPGVPPLAQQCWPELGRFAKLVAASGLAEPELLPRGTSALAADVAARQRRRRLLDATARLCREQGYASLTVGQIAAAARVPRTAFYALFEGKREAVMAAQTLGLQRAMAVAAAEYSPAAPWALRIWKMLRGFLGYLAEAPDYAHLDFVDSYAAGSEAVRHRHRNHMAFGLFFEDGYRRQPADVRLPWASIGAIAGGVLGLVRKPIVAGEPERMLAVAPAAGYTILAPFIGPQEAARQARTWARGAG